MIKIEDYISSDPLILNGQKVFKNTRVPVDSLFDHLESGLSIDDFINDFPTVTKEQAISVLEIAEELLVSLR